MANNSAVILLRSLYKGAHDVLEGTMADVTPEMAHWQPPQLADAIGASYAHIITGEDFVLNGVARQITPLLAGEWVSKTGLSEPPPRGAARHEWSQRVQIDLPALRAYGQAVYAHTDEYLASLSDEDLTQPIDLSTMGFGSQTLGWLLGIMLANVQWHTGEISCVKGLQGHKGYPF